MPNETELAILTGMPVDSEAEIEAAARHLLARGLGAVIVVMGSRGALLARPDRTKRIAAVRVTPIDTTGAGVAFAGSCAGYCVGGVSLDAALAKAARYAADSITRRGTQRAYATEAEFEVFCRQGEGQSGRRQ